MLVHQRAPYEALAAEPDPVRQVQLLAELICEIQERSAPIQAAYREAAAIDPTVAAGLVDEHRRRLESFGAIVRMLPAGRLKLTPQECIDTAWAVGSADVLLLLRNVRGWSWDEIRQWLARTLVEVLVEQPG